MYCTHASRVNTGQWATASEIRTLEIDPLALAPHTSSHRTAYVHMNAVSFEGMYV